MSSLFLFIEIALTLKRKHIYNKKTAQDFERFAVLTRLELATSCVTGRHSNQTELQHLLFYFHQLRYFVVDYGCKDTTFFHIRKHFFKKKLMFFQLFLIRLIINKLQFNKYFIKKYPSSLISCDFIPKTLASSISFKTI